MLSRFRSGIRKKSTQLLTTSLNSPTLPPISLVDSYSKLKLPNEQQVMSIFDQALVDLVAIEAPPQKIGGDLATEKLKNIGLKLQNEIKSGLQQNIPLEKQIESLNETIINELNPYKEHTSSILTLENLQSTLDKPTATSSSSTTPSSSSSSATETSSGSLLPDKVVMLRLMLTAEYLKSLHNLLESRDIPEDVIEPNLMKIINCVLLESSSDRLNTHLSLFGQELNQVKFQIGLYSLYNPEIEVAANVLSSYPINLKKQSKFMKKIVKNYLMDDLELNTKARMVIAWGDPNYSGLKNFDDKETFLALPHVFNSREQYFKEGSTIARSLVLHLKQQVALKYETKKDDRKTLMKGAVFFVACCILDEVIQLL